LPISFVAAQYEQSPSVTIFRGRLHDSLEKLQRRSLVPLRGDYRFQNLALAIDSASEIAELAVDLHKHLIQMPPPLRIVARVRKSPITIEKFDVKR
jgi:hypothetical protein